MEETAMALATEENPPELLAPLESLADHDWCVVRVESRHEKRLAFFLSQAGIPYFLPMIERVSSSRNRSLVVLFNGFIFVAYRPGDGTLDIVKSSHRTVGSPLFTKNQPRIRQELALLASETAQRRTLQVEARQAYRTGEYIRITSGPMMGLEGRVAYVQGQARIFVDLLLLGQLVSMELIPEVLEKVESA